MPGEPSLLFRTSWAVRTGLFGALAGSMALAAMLFRHIARRAAAGGYCGTPELGTAANCAMAQALGGWIATALALGAIVVAGLAFWAAFMWWKQSQVR